MKGTVEIPEGRWESIYSRYKVSLNWLESLINDPQGERYLVPKSSKEMREGQIASFERTHRFLAFLDNPQNNYHIIHVAGTGGKGSTTTMIDALLRAAGQKTGSHTSPYVQVPNEKLVINGQIISPSNFSELVDNFRQRYEYYIQQDPKGRPLYGETWTALAYFYFSRQGVSWAAIETGMGGRFDPTNVNTSDIAVITNIDFDHVPQLGTTLGDIAWHKAGIIKPGRPVITGETKPEPLSVIKLEAIEKNSPILILGQDYSAKNIRKSDDGIILDVHTPFGDMHNLYVSLEGSFQGLNAVTALTATLYAADRHGFSLTEEQIRNAMATLSMKGRMERMQAEPLIIIDGAHNPQKMRAAAATLKQDYTGLKKTLIIGMLQTKDAADSLKQIVPFVDAVIVTEPNVVGKPSFTVEQMQEFVTSIRPDIRVEGEKDVQKAIADAMNNARKDEMIFITGSIYMLGHARSFWEKKEDLLNKIEYQQV